MLAKNNETNPELSQVLLPSEKDFLITRTSDDFSKVINITHLWPRKLGSERILTVSTTTMNAGSLCNLRLEKIDDQYFVINDSNNSYTDPIALSVISEEVGHRMIKAIATEFSTDKKHNELGISEKYFRYNEIAEKFCPLITLSCVALLSICGSIFLLFK